jgi:hypothetical protein
MILLRDKEIERLAAAKTTLEADLQLLAAYPPALFSFVFLHSFINCVGIWKAKNPS